MQFCKLTLVYFYKGLRVQVRGQVRAQLLRSCLPRGAVSAHCFGSRHLIDTRHAIEPGRVPLAALLLLPHTRSSSARQ